MAHVPMSAVNVSCPLCQPKAERVVWQAPLFRVIHAAEPLYPAFYRVVWQAHAPEWTDLVETEQAICMRAVSMVECVLRQQLKPTKVNLATLGNLVPHLHWHVVARFESDAHFPQPIWASPTREVVTMESSALVDHLQTQLPALEQALVQAFSSGEF